MRMVSDNGFLVGWRTASAQPPLGEAPDQKIRHIELLGNRRSHDSQVPRQQEAQVFSRSRQGCIALVWPTLETNGMARLYVDFGQANVSALTRS